MKAFRNKDEKIQYVLDSIDAGKDTETIAKDLGYKNYKSLDMFMRREGYLKENRLGNYYPKSGRGIIEGGDSHRASVTSKALEIIQRFTEGELDRKSVV